MALYHSSIEWFEIRFRKPIPKGLPSSYKQYQILTDLFVAHLNEAAIAEKRPTATRLNSIIHPHPERDFFNTLP